MSKSKPISWVEKPGDFRGEIGATIALDAHRWHNAGAEFARIDDGDGETVGLARGSAATGAGKLDFGVLDYGEPTTFLLVAANQADAAREAGEVIAALSDAGILSAEEVLDEESPYGSAVAEEAVGPIESEIFADVPSAPKRRKGSKRSSGPRAGAVRIAKVVSFDEETGFAVVRPHKSRRVVAIHRRDISPVPRGGKLKAGATVRIKRLKPGKTGKVRLSRGGRAAL